jgi:hypothetical protein
VALEELVPDFAEGGFGDIPVAQTLGNPPFGPPEADEIQRLGDPTEEISDGREQPGSLRMASSAWRPAVVRHQIKL